MHSYLKTGFTALLLAFMAVGCGNQRDTLPPPDVAALRTPPESPPAAPAQTALRINLPRSQADIDALYNGQTYKVSAIALGPRTAGSQPDIYPGVVAHPDWNVTVTREWRHIVIHHSASPTGSASVFNLEHVKRGWQGLGYHFVIGNGSGSGDGEVEVGYRWKQQETGAHAGNAEYNEHGIGICLVGDFEDGRQPTTRQMASLRQLVRFLQVKTGIPTSEVIGHCNVPPPHTLCPGNLDMNAFRASLGDGAIGVPIHYVQPAKPAFQGMLQVSSSMALP